MIKCKCFINYQNFDKIHETAFVVNNIKPLKKNNDKSNRIGKNVIEKLRLIQVTNFPYTKIQYSNNIVCKVKMHEI